MDGFNVLSNSRSLFSPSLGYSGSVGFIPLTEIECYARIFCVEDVETFTIVIRHLDRIYVEFQNDKLTAKQGSK